MALIDKKSRTSIMYGVMICLTVAIIFCVIKIATRPPVVTDEDQANFYLPAHEKIDLSELETQVAENKEEVHIEVEDRARLIEDNVNIRSGPGTDYDRLGSAYYGNMFDYVSQSHDGWTKIIYDGKTAYVYTQYVELVSVVMNVEGEYTEYMGLDAPTAEELIVWSDEGTEPEGEGEGETNETPAEN